MKSLSPITVLKILLLFLHLTYTSDGLATHFVPAIFPKKPVVLSGSTLVINCTLGATNTDLEADLLNNLSQSLIFQLQFQSNDNLSTSVQHFDDRTIQLHIYNVQRWMSGGQVTCSVKDRLDSVTATVTVADKPDINGTLKCVVYNQRYMTCTWPEPDTGIPTTYWLQYYSNKLNRWLACPSPAHRSCTWPEKGEENYKNVHFYEVRQFAQNQLGFWRQNGKIVLADIVKPDAVTNLEVRRLTSQSAVVTWTQPCLVGAETITRIVYSSVCDNSSSDHVFSLSNRTRLLNLVPASIYTLSVSCGQVIGDALRGFWSDSVTLQFQTTADVPGENPSIFHGTFSSVSQTADLDTVEIFWEPVPRCLRHDNTSSVEIFYRPAENATTSNLMADSVIKDSVNWSSVSASEDSVSVELALQTAFNYEVVVLAKTSVGYNHSLPLVPLFVPKCSNRPHFNERLIVMRNYTEVTVRLPSEHIDRVYWCHTSINSRRCQTPLHWANVEDGTRDLKLRFNQSDLVKFAVRAQFNNSPAGVTVSDLKWSVCVYDVNKGVMQPTDVKFSRHNAPLSLVLEWTEPSCTLSSYITDYYVHYCRLNGSTCTDDKVLVITAPATRAVINDLVPGSIYQARVMSASSIENSSFTDFVVSDNVVAAVEAAKVTDNNSSTSVLPVVIIAVVLVLVVVVVSLCVWCVIRCRQRIPIKIPDAVKPEFITAETDKSSAYLIDSTAASPYHNTSLVHSVDGNRAVTVQQKYNRHSTTAAAVINGINELCVVRP